MEEDSLSELTSARNARRVSTLSLERRAILHNLRRSTVAQPDLAIDTRRWSSPTIMVWVAGEGLQPAGSPLLAQSNLKVPASRFKLLRGASAGCVIDSSAERPITLRQLRAVWAYVVEHCVADDWTNAITGLPLTPETCCLYDVTRYVIKPATAERMCSYVELIADTAREPEWFVSHWWGERFHRFLACVEQHAADHGYDDDVAYWVCAFALNQHVQSGDLNAGSTDNPFVRAIGLAKGRVLSIIDDKCNTYTRVWCVLEIFHVLQTFGTRGAFDIYTAKPNCSAYDMSSFDAVKDAVGADGFRGSEWLAEVYRRMPIVHNRQAVGLTDGPAECDRGEAGKRHRLEPLEPAE